MIFYQILGMKIQDLTSIRKPQLPNNKKRILIFKNNNMSHLNHNNKSKIYCLIASTQTLRKMTKNYRLSHTTKLISIFHGLLMECLQCLYKLGSWASKYFLDYEFIRIKSSSIFTKYIERS